MAYLTSEIALAQTHKPPSHTHGSHCPSQCAAILAVLSDIQQVQQKPIVSTHQTLHSILKKKKKNVCIVMMGAVAHSMKLAMK